MPRRPTATDARWLIPGATYGYVEANDYGIAVVRFQGRRLSLGIDFDKKNQRAILKAAAKKLEELKHPTPRRIEDPKKVTVFSAETAFRNDYNVEDMPYRTKVSFDGMFRWFFPVDFKLNDDAIYHHLNKRLPQLRRELSENYLLQLVGRFDTFVKYCRFQQWLTRNPWHGGIARPKRPTPDEKTPLTPAQIRGLYRYCLQQAAEGTQRTESSPKWRDVAALLQLFNATGLRMGEAVSLHWAEMVESTEGVNTIEPGRIAIRRAKNGPRDIPYGPGHPWLEQIERAVTRLRKLQAEPSRGVRGRRRVRVFRWTRPQQAYKCIAEAFTAVGIPIAKIKSHLFRSTVEDRQDALGVPEDVVLRIVGHTKRTKQKDYKTNNQAEQITRKLLQHGNH